MKTPPSGQIYLVRFRAKPDSLNRPVAIRLRKMLKNALRGFGLQCVGLAEQHANGQETELTPTDGAEGVNP